MKVLIIGTGYVGTTTGLVFCEMGHKVTGLDLDKQKLESLLDGKLHFHEPGLDELLQKHMKYNNITFTHNTEEAIKEHDVIFICVGTPQGKDGSADLRYVKEVAKSIGTYMNKYKVIIHKSTVPVGTSDSVVNWIKEYQILDIPFDVVSNPEFLREGSALEDALNPDRIVIGSSNEKARNIMKELYKDFQCPIVYTDQKASELIKYAANSFLALKISYINEISRLCDFLNIDVEEVSNGIGLDSRIGKKFLKAGIGYGGSCFPKDVNALLYTANMFNVHLNILESAVKTNEKQPLIFIDKVKNSLKSLKNKKIAVLGLSFKPNTDDIRDSPSLKIINILQECGAIIRVHDPVVILNKVGVEQFKEVDETVRDADAILICTDWELYRQLNWSKIKDLVKTPYLFDGRNILDSTEMNTLGFYYQGIGR